MEKTLVLQRLRDTIDKLKELPDENFNYAHFVADSSDGCGTVCCVAGWYPKWFPEAGLKWVTSIRGNVIDIRASGDIDTALAKWHGINEYLIDALFYGSPIVKVVPAVLKLSTASVKEVAKRFEAIHNAIDKSLISYV